MKVTENKVANQFLGLIFLCGFIIPPQAVLAQEALSQNPEDTAPQDSESDQTDQSILQYQDRITELESVYGPYNSQLGEQLLGLGLLYKNKGDYEAAADALQRSLNIKRITEGIQDTAQVPVLNALIEVNTIARNWDALDQNYHLLLWVLKRNLSAGDPTLLPFIEAVGQWKLYAYSNSLLDEPADKTLGKMIDVYKFTVDILEEQYGKNDPRLIAPLNGLSLARYHLVKFANNTPASDYQSVGRRTTLQRVCTLVMTPQGPQTVCYMQEVADPGYYITKQIQKESRVNMYMNSVRESLEWVVDINAANPSLGIRDHALALANLGDWYFLNRKRNDAIKNYKQAYHLLDSTGQDQETIEYLFGKPVLLPSMIKNPYIDNENVRSAGEPYVKVAFDVTTRGKSRNIKVIEYGGADNPSMRRRAREYIKASLFRPRLEDGELVETEQIVMELSGSILTRNSRQVTENNSVVTGSRILR